ncbi:MAG: arsenate reductase [Curvibacter sp.]|jgi:arsenate reductase
MNQGITLYGITNCDTVRRARAWLTEQQVAVHFHDFNKRGVPEERLDHWLTTVGWEKLVNRQGSTWRKLQPQAQAVVRESCRARSLMLSQPSVIKRPVVEWDAQHVTVGFDAADWATRI